MNSPRTVYQVSDLANEMRLLMETSYPEIWIEGELSSLSTPASGHLYFSLKDENAQLRCAMFRNRASINRYKPKAGDLVKVRAKISVYTARGDLQCIVQHIEEAGEGVLQRRFEELKTKLSQAGLFGAEHKRKLPAFPKHIGLITSPSGAAIKDILSTLQRRCPNIPVTIYPAVVQGEGAAATLVQALADANAHAQCDVLIIGRGGGSLEDLWCFNDEDLANAIFNSPVPIVSAVGHEVDTTIADYVADLRAPTPTAAAELLSPDYTVLHNNIAGLAKRLRPSCQRYLEKQAQRVDNRFQRLQHPAQRIKQNQQSLSKATLRLKRLMLSRLVTEKLEMSRRDTRFSHQSPQSAIKEKSTSTDTLGQRLLRAQKQSLSAQQQKHHHLGAQLHLVSPLATLDRGFAIARDQQQNIVREAQSIKPGAELHVQLKSGALECEVSKVVK